MKKDLMKRIRENGRNPVSDSAGWWGSGNGKRSLEKILKEHWKDAKGQHIVEKTIKIAL